MISNRDKTFNIINIINIVKTRYKLVIYFTLSIIIFIIFYAVTLQSKSTFTTTIEIGKKWDWNLKGTPHLIESPLVTMARLRESIIPSLIKKTEEFTTSNLSYNLYNPKKGRLITIEIKVSNAFKKQAIELLQSVANELSREHQSLTKPLQYELQRQVRFLENQIRQYESDITMLQERESDFVSACESIPTFTTGPEKTINMLFLEYNLNMLSSRIESVQDLKEKSFQSLAKKRMQLSCFTPTRALTLPVRSPIYPGPSLPVLLLLGTLAGITGGIMLALFFEFFAD